MAVATSTNQDSTNDTENPGTTGKRLRALGLLAAIAVLAAACGTGTSANETADDATTTTEAALGDSGLPSLGEEEEINPAADDGDSVIDDGEAVDPDASEQEVIQAYMDCMDAEGVDVAALETSADDGEIAALTSSPEFLAADQVCQVILEDAFGSFEMDPEMEAALADRSADLAACGREVLGIEIPDDVLMLDENDPRMLELESMETTPEQDAGIEACFEEHLGDIIDDDGVLVDPNETEGE